MQRTSLSLGLTVSSVILLTACIDDHVVEPAGPAADVVAQSNGPTLLDRNLAVRAVIDGLTTPTTMAFLDTDDFFILEKNTGQVKRVVDGSVQSVVLDLAVNHGQERGLLGIALHPAFPQDAGVYLYWTESTSGEDSNVLSNTPLFGNRVDRFVWNGTSLELDRNLIRLRAIQDDDGEPQRGNHNGGAIQFGPDHKLYIFVGDVGRRGHLQNLLCGPVDSYDCPPATPVSDDQYGGPEPDGAHLTGVVLRLNDDGTTPADNPFFAAGSDIGGETGANIQKTFSYGHRNSFGMAFDPRSGSLWIQENGDDSFSEINRVAPGMNGGWIQITGPVARIGQYREIETSTTYFGLQQSRWPPTNIAGSALEALGRLYMLPGAHYADPEFSWKFEVAPGGIGFISGRGLGPQHDGSLIVGAARDDLLGGHLFRFRLTGDRRRIAVDDARLQDRVADNFDKWDITESESLLFGTDFGVVTNVQTGPNGNLFVVSLSHGTVYEIHRRDVGNRR